MNSILNLFFVLTFLTSFGQSEIGIGVVSIHFDDTTKIEFYETSELNKSSRTIEFFNDESIKGWNIKNLESHKEWLKPESMWLDYGQFRFRCKTKKEGSFEVYITESQTMWILDQDITQFMNWEEYLQTMFSVERTDKTTQKIYSKPFIKSEIIESKNDCFRVKQMKGEWIEVETAEHCKTQKNISGWIRWKDGNKILINYYTTG